MRNKTKIIATLGPVTNSKEKIQELYDAGVNIIRFNFSHANYDDAQKSIDIIKSLNNSGKTNLGLLLDTKGPEIRTGDISGKNNYKKGDIFKIYIDENIELSDNALFCDYKELISDVNIGGIIVIDSGLLNVELTEKHDNYILAKALNDAVIGSRRHINLPGVNLSLPGVTEKDRDDILFAIKNDFAYIAASFIRSAVNVNEIKDIFEEKSCSTIKIISKIENQEGIKNLDEIIETSDGIMVARGDLGIEVPIAKLPIYQKEIVEKCNRAGKFVITATHLLETMIDNPIPTRAETSDVFNSVLQKADCLMLSGETTIGKFPIESVKMMADIISEAESVVEYSYEDYSNDHLSVRDIEKKLLIRSALFVGSELGVKTVIILTKTGRLARITSAFRPKFPVYSFTPFDTSVKNTTVLFGIRSRILKEWDKGNFSNTLDAAIQQLLNDKVIEKEDKIIAINDIQKQGQEFPIMQIIDLKNY